MSSVRLKLSSKSFSVSARRRFERQRFQRAHLRDQAEEEGEDARADARLLVLVVPLLLVAGAREIVEELLARDAGARLSQLVLFQVPGDLGHLGNDRADGMPERPEGEVEAGEHVLQFEAVGLDEGALEQLLRHLEADEVVVRLGRVVAAGHLEHVEAELDPQVRRRVVPIGDDLAEFPSQLRDTRAAPTG